MAMEDEFGKRTAERGVHTDPWSGGSQGQGGGSLSGGRNHVCLRSRNPAQRVSCTLPSYPRLGQGVVQMRPGKAPHLIFGLNCRQRNQGT